MYGSWAAAFLVRTRRFGKQFAVIVAIDDVNHDVTGGKSPGMAQQRLLSTGEGAVIDQQGQGFLQVAFFIGTLEAQRSGQFALRELALA